MNWLFEYIHYRQKRKLIPPKLRSELSKKHSFPEEWTKHDKQFRISEVLIPVEDLGAGSKYMTNQRKVKDIYQYSKTSEKYQVLLARLLQHFECKLVLELGTSLGIGTRVLAMNSIRVSTVEGCPTTSKLAKDHFEQVALQNIDVYNDSFENFINTYQGEKFDFVYIDGHHTGEAMMKYLNILPRICTKGCIYICDDIRWSDSMKEGFQKAEKNFLYSLDFWRMGLLTNREINQ